MRLDCYLFEQGMAQSRQKAKELIGSGAVWVEGKQVFKPSCEITSQEVRVETQEKQWVARSGEKLYSFVRSYGIEIKGKEVLDVGSSTGGFSEVLLHFGVKSVVCVDVGSNQLHPKIREDERVSVFENQDIRTFSHQPFELVVCDVSFISLDLIIEKISELTQKECILLFKPQFEVGKKAKRNKRGVIIENQKVQERLEEFLERVQELGMVIKGVQKSSLKGKCGNEEYFIYLHK